MLVIRQATTSDVAAIIALLQTDDLRTEGILEHLTRYWVAEDGPRLIGAIGLELGDTCVLLRSAIVTSGERGNGVGRKMTEQALEWASESGYRFAYCFSTDAGSYWTARGFNICSVEEVVCAVPHAPQVRLFDRLGWLPTEVAYRIALGQTNHV
jgi:N-acetylglutamate synthase-like GNAT family acetyltransferase